MTKPVPSWSHLWWCVVFAFLALGPGDARLGAAELADGSLSSGGSVLRQISGVRGLEGTADAEIAEESLDEPSYAQPPTDVELPPHWVNPYQIGDIETHPSHPNTWLSTAWLPFWGHRTPYRERHQNLGLPLLGTSWLNRPLGAGWFVGGVNGAPLIRDHVDQNAGFYGGYRFTYDYDYYWGMETRVGAAAIGLEDYQGPTVPRTSDFVTWDMELLYYPWGDSRIRPYLMGGLGVGVVHFQTDNDITLRRGLPLIPWGFGVKYRVNEYLVARFEVIDNWCIGRAEIDTMHNVSITGGIEVRFGGVRKLYWPWYPDKYMW